MLVYMQLEWLWAKAQLGWPTQLAGVWLSQGLCVKQPVEPGRAERSGVIVALLRIVRDWSTDGRQASAGLGVQLGPCMLRC